MRDQVSEGAAEPFAPFLTVEEARLASVSKAGARLLGLRQPKNRRNSGAVVFS